MTLQCQSTQGCKYAAEVSSQSANVQVWQMKAQQRQVSQSLLRASNLAESAQYRLCEKCAMPRNPPYSQSLYPVPLTVPPLEAMGDALAAPLHTPRHSFSFIACRPTWQLGSVIVWAAKDAFLQTLSAHRGLQESVWQAGYRAGLSTAWAVRQQRLVHSCCAVRPRDIHEYASPHVKGLLLPEAGHRSRSGRPGQLSEGGYGPAGAMARSLDVCAGRPACLKGADGDAAAPLGE